MPTVEIVRHTFGPLVDQSQHIGGEAEAVVWITRSGRVQVREIEGIRAGTGAAVDLMRADISAEAEVVAPFGPGKTIACDDVRARGISLPGAAQECLVVTVRRVIRKIYHWKSVGSGISKSQRRIPVAWVCRNTGIVVEVVSEVGNIQKVRSEGVSFVEPYFMLPVGLYAGIGERSAVLGASLPYAPAIVQGPRFVVVNP